MSHAVISRQDRSAVIYRLLNLLDLKAFQYCSCSSCHLFAMHPLSAHPQPMLSWSCPAEDPLVYGRHPGVWSCHCLRPSIMSFLSCRWILAVSSHRSSSSMAFSHCCILTDSNGHLKICSLSLTGQVHWGHLACGCSPHCCIFFPSGRNFAASLETHCQCDKERLFIALVADFQSIVFEICGEKHSFIAQWFSIIFPFRCWRRPVLGFLFSTNPQWHRSTLWMECSGVVG